MDPQSNFRSINIVEKCSPRLMLWLIDIRIISIFFFASQAFWLAVMNGQHHFSLPTSNTSVQVNLLLQPSAYQTTPTNKSDYSVCVSRKASLTIDSFVNILLFKLKGNRL